MKTWRVLVWDAEDSERKAIFTFEFEAANSEDAEWLGRKEAYYRRRSDTAVTSFLAKASAID